MSWDTFNPTKAPASSPIEAAQSYTTKAVNLGVQSMNTALKFGEELSRARSPTDVANAVTNYNRQTFETLTEVFKAMTEVGREAASKAENAAGLGD
jgi:hypothetical protein